MTHKCIPNSKVQHKLHFIPKAVQKLGFSRKMTYNTKVSDTKISALLLMVFVRFLLIESTQVRKGSTAGKK